VPSGPAEAPKLPPSLPSGGGQAGKLRSAMDVVAGTGAPGHALTDHPAESRLRASHSISLALEGSQDLSEAAPHLLRTIGEVLEWDVGALWAVEPSAPALRLVRLWLRAASVGAAFGAATRAIPFTRGLGLPGRVWAEAQPVWVPDMAAQPQLPRAAAAKADGLHAALAFPFTSGTTVLGVLEFFSQDMRPLDEAVLDMARVFGHQIGQFIERRGAEQRLRLILKNALDASVLMSASGAILEWNPRAEQMFGWPASEIVGHQLADVIIPTTHRAAHARGLAHFLATGEGPLLLSHVETTAIRRDGAEFPVELTITPLHVNGIWTFHGFVRDITARKRLERARRSKDGS